MRYWEHVYELRRRMLMVAAFLVASAAVGYVFVPRLVAVVAEHAGEELYATAISEGFITRVKVALLIGAVSAVPMCAIQILSFVAPAVSRGTKVWASVGVVAGFALFAAGAVFAFETVMPISIRFLKSETFFPGGVGRLISYGRFLAFFFQFVLGFGVFFQFPVLLMALLAMRVVDWRYLIVNFKYFMGVIFLVAAVVTPPDLVSQVLLAAPMVVLYFATVAVARLFQVGT